jgi:hypothetical protein
MLMLLNHLPHRTEHVGAPPARRARAKGAFTLQLKNSRAEFAARAQRFLSGSRKISAAALIEAPLCIQPGQRYAIRIRVLGRDEPRPEAAASTEAPPTGLSALTRGEYVSIEVRSSLSQDEVSVAQRAEVCLPGSDYLAEVTFPMQPRSSSPRGQRERVYVLFKDGLCRPLYDRPFVIELFISPLVRVGREGHFALAVPI